MDDELSVVAAPSDRTSRPGEAALAFVIPAYQPGAILTDIIRAIMTETYGLNVDTLVIVVDDGSTADRQPIFRELAGWPGVVVLRHAVNLGKGAALKTAFNDALVRYGDRLLGVVTADADGQHLPHDIAAVARALLSRPDALVIGSRRFDGATPARSRIGNLVTRGVFKLFTGHSLVDTQSGLRALPLAVLKRCLRLQTQGYDYELEMLVVEAQHGTRFVQHPITTVYEPGNPTSHFNPILDSAKIYYVFIRFSALSLTSAALDYFIFLAVLLLGGRVLTSIVAARLVTGTLYFHVARTRVFRSGGAIKGEAIKFVALVVMSMLASYGLIMLQIDLLRMPAVVAKLIAETTMFFANFAVQRVFVFRPRGIVPHGGG